MDAEGWTATGVAAVEAVIIGGLVVYKRSTQRGRRLRVSLWYHGPDTTDERLEGERAGRRTHSGQSGQPGTTAGALDGVSSRSMSDTPDETTAPEPDEVEPDDGPPTQPVPVVTETTTVRPASDDES